jgi:hypothetical protein
MDAKRCASCHRSFQPRPQAPRQTYCSATDCQRERRRRWQISKRHEDPDYRDNDARCRKRWAAEHPDYWKRYRHAHPDYTVRNRILQQKRNWRRRTTLIANEDASACAPAPSAGRYRLIRIADQKIANEDAWIVEIRVLSCVSADACP